MTEAFRESVGGIPTGEHKEEEMFEQGVIIDFDRTLGDANTSMDRLYLAAGPFGISVQDIREAQQLVENDGGSFNPLSIVENRGADMEAFSKAFISLDGPPILYDDALPLIQNLDEHGMPYHVLTYGVSREWQELKLRASGYKGTATIIEHASKGEYMSRWLNEEGNFSIRDGMNTPLFQARSLCLVDDKAKAFSSLPPKSDGFLIQRGATQLKSQQGEVPASVRKITSLNQIRVVNNRLVRAA